MMDEQQQKSGHPCLCQNCLRWSPAEKTGRGSQPNRPSCPPDDQVNQWTRPSQSMDTTQSINGHDQINQWTRPSQSIYTTQSINGHDPINQWTRPCQSMDTTQSINGHVPINQCTDLNWIRLLLSFFRSLRGFFPPPIFNFLRKSSKVCLAYWIRSKSANWGAH